MFALVSAIMVLGAPIPPTPVLPPKVSAAELQAWVRELDSSKFKVRDMAEKRLRTAGIDAVPVLTETALTNNSVEVAERAIRLLGDFLLSEDEVLSRAVRPHLQRIADSKSAVAGPAATAIKNLRNAYLDRLRAAGAQFQETDGLHSLSLEEVKDIKALLPLLRDFPELVELDASTKSFGDEEMKLLPTLPNLDHFNLFMSNIGDDSLKEFKRFPKLRSIPMGRTRVTDAGLAHLAHLTELEYVGVRGNKVTDAGLVHLKKLTKLTGLYLSETQITDAGLAHISGLTKLERVYLSKINLTDKGIEHIKAWKQLTYAEIHGTKITAMGMEDLKMAIPNLRIVTEGRDD